MILPYQIDRQWYGYRIHKFAFSSSKVNTWVAEMERKSSELSHEPFPILFAGLSQPSFFHHASDHGGAKKIKDLGK